MDSERLSSNNTEAGKPAWKVERERELARKRKIGEKVIGATAIAIMAIVLSHCAKTSDIMGNEERAKNVKTIKVEGVVFHDGVNARKEPVVGNTEPNQLANIGEEGESVEVSYDGDAYHYENENDPNGGWFGFNAVQLSDELLEESYISQADANSLKSDEKYGDGVVWFNEKYVTITEPNETSYMAEFVSDSTN